jgi:hypothetical protein
LKTKGKNQKNWSDILKTKDQENEKKSRENFEMKTPFKRGDNLRFIADYLLRNPGSTMTEVRRALCKFRTTGYHRGMYTAYFAKTYILGNQKSYVDAYWYKQEGGWYLTLAGYGLATVDKNLRLA